MKFWTKRKRKNKKGEAIATREVVEARQRLQLALGFTLLIAYIALVPLVANDWYPWAAGLAGQPPELTLWWQEQLRRYLVLADTIAAADTYAFVQLLAILPVLAVGRELLLKGGRLLLKGYASVESLLFLSALIALGQSVYGALLLLQGRPFYEAPQLYFVVVAGLLTAGLLGSYIQVWAKAYTLEAPDKPAAMLQTVSVVLAVVVGVSGFFMNLSEGFIGQLLGGLLLVACPIGLILAKPLAVAAAAWRCAKLGIVIKDTGILEKAQLITLAIFDKTGTITVGRPKLSKVIAYKGAGQEGLLVLAATMVEQSGSTMTELLALAKAGAALEKPSCSQAALSEDGWVYARSFNENIRLGSYEYISSYATFPRQALAELEPYSDEGKLLLFLAVGRNLYATFVLTDTLRPETVQAMKALEALQVRTVVMTGDNKRAANYTCRQAGAQQVVAELLPSHKAELVESFKLGGEVVAMIGDADNDAPAMAVGDLGIAVGSGSKAAWQAANVVLTTDDLRSVAALLYLSRACVGCGRRNVLLACLGAVALWPVAAGLAYFYGGLSLNPLTVMAVELGALGLMLINTLAMLLKP